MADLGNSPFVRQSSPEARQTEPSKRKDSIPSIASVPICTKSSRPAEGDPLSPIEAIPQNELLDRLDETLLPIQLPVKGGRQDFVLHRAIGALSSNGFPVKPQNHRHSDDYIKANMPYNNTAIPPSEEITGSTALPCKIVYFGIAPNID